MRRTPAPLTVHPDRASMRGGTVLTAGPLPVNLNDRPGLPLCEANVTCIIGGVRIPGLVDRGNLWRLFLDSQAREMVGGLGSADRLRSRRSELERLGIELTPPSVSCVAPPLTDVMLRIPVTTTTDARTIAVPFAVDLCGVILDDFGWQKPAQGRGAALHYFGRPTILDLAPAVVAPGAPLVVRLVTPLGAALPSSAPVMLRFGAFAEAWFIPVQHALGSALSEYVLFGEVPAPAVGGLALSVSLDGQRFFRATPRIEGGSIDGWSVRDSVVVLPPLHLAYASPTTVNASGGEFVSVGVYSFSISPAAGPVSGGTVVLVHAEHLGGGRDYRCRFGEAVVVAEFLAVMRPQTLSEMRPSFEQQQSPGGSNSTAGADYDQPAAGWRGWRDGLAAAHTHAPSPAPLDGGGLRPGPVSLLDLAEIAQGTAVHQHVFEQVGPGSPGRSWTPLRRPPGRDGQAVRDPLTSHKGWSASSAGALPGPVTLRCVAPRARRPGVVPFAISVDRGVTWSVDAAAYHPTSVPTFTYYATLHLTSAVAAAEAPAVVPAEGGALLRMPILPSLDPPQPPALSGEMSFDDEALQQAVSAVDASTWLGVPPPRAPHQWGFPPPVHVFTPRCRFGGVGGVVHIARLDVRAGMVSCVAPPLAELTLGAAERRRRSVAVDITFNGLDYELASAPLALPSANAPGPRLIYAFPPTPAEGWSFTPVSGLVSGGTVVSVMGFHALAVEALLRRGFPAESATDYDVWCVFGHSAGEDAASAPREETSTAPRFFSRTRMIRASILSRAREHLGGVAQCVTPPSGALLTQSPLADSARYDFGARSPELDGADDEPRPPDYPLAADLALVISLGASNATERPLLIAELRGAAADQEAPAARSLLEGGAQASARFSYSLPLSVLAFTPAVINSDGGADVRLSVAGAGGEGARTYVMRFGRTQVWMAASFDSECVYLCILPSSCTAQCRYAQCLTSKLPRAAELLVPHRPSSPRSLRHHPSASSLDGMRSRCARLATALPEHPSYGLVFHSARRCRLMVNTSPLPRARFSSFPPVVSVFAC